MSEVAAQDYAATMARRYFELKGGGQATPAASPSTKPRRKPPGLVATWCPDPVDPDGQPAVVTGGELKMYCTMILELQKELHAIREDRLRLWDRIAYLERRRG